MTLTKTAIVIATIAAINATALAAPGVPEMAETEKTTYSTLVTGTTTQANEIAVTGVIVDAGELGLESTFSPVIYDTNGRVIYGVNDIDPDYSISRGMVEYATDLTEAVRQSRAGAKPLLVKAVSVKSGKNSANRVNVVVTAEDGDRILMANEENRMLKNCAVVFVK